MSQSHSPSIFTAILPLMFSCLVLTSVADSQLFERFGLGSSGNRKQDAAKARARFAQEFPLVLKQGEIRFDFPEDMNTASSIASAIASGGGGSSSSSGDRFIIKSSSPLIEVEIGNLSRARMLGNREGEAREYVSIKELNNRWHTEFVAAEDYSVFSHLDTEAKVMFHLKSGKAGAQLIMFDGPKMVSLKGSSYLELVGQSEFQQILDRAERWGIKLPSSVTSTALDDLMLAVLSVSEAEWKDFENDFADLSANSFKEREAATQRLKAELNQWKHLVAWGLTDDAVSLELKSRLLAVIKDEASEAAKQLNGLISAKLMENPEKLVDLLAHPSAGKESISSAILSRLKNVTEKDFGTDVVSWRKWAESNKNPAAQPVTKQAQEQPAKKRKDSDARKKPGNADVARQVTIGLAREEVSTLLTLEINDQDQIRVDRRRWAQRFGNKEIGQLLKETQERFQESGLPTSWLDLGGGYDLSTIDYPQLLVAQMDDSLSKQLRQLNQADQFQMQMQMQSRRFNNFMVSRKSRNREIQLGQVSFRLELHPESNQGMNAAEVPQAQYFRFSYVDEAKDDSLVLDERPKDGLSLLIRCIESNDFVGIGQNDKQCWIHVSTDEGSFSASNESPRKLFQEHAAELKRLLHPVLQNYGIGLTESTGGTLEIKNAVLKPENPRNERRP